MGESRPRAHGAVCEDGTDADADDRGIDDVGACQEVGAICRIRSKESPRAGRHYMVCAQPSGQRDRDAFKGGA